jgi:phage terminase large subunit
MINNPSDKQRIALQYLHDAECDFVGYGGAAFGGKSYLLCTWLINNSLNFAGTRWGMGRRELTTLKKTTLKTLFKVFDEMKIREGQHYNYNQQLNVITFFNKSEILLIDTAYKPSDPLYTRFGGYELTGCAIDESAETDFKAIDTLFTRLGRCKNHEYGIRKKMLETFNPVKNHVYYRYYKPWKDGTLRPTYRFVRALPADNPAPETHDYVQGIINNSDKQTVERLIYGNFEYEDDPDKIFDMDALLDIFTNTHVQGGDKYISVDVARGGKDKSTVFVWDGFKVTDISVFKTNTVPQLADFVKAKAMAHGIPNSHIVVDDSGVGGGVTDLLRGCRPFIGNAVAIKTNPVNNFRNLRTQCYYHLSKLVNGSQIYVSSTKYRDNIVKELEVLKPTNLDKDQKIMLIGKDTIKALIGGVSPDYADALMMRMIFDLAPKRKIMAIG